MTGQELFCALNFVDERYIMEAETARVPKTPWMKILSVAACLCILLAGAFALEHVSMQKAAPEAAAPMAPAPEAVPEAAPPMPESAAPESAMEEEPPAGELFHVPYAKLRVVKVLEEGSFEAIVEADEPMEMDTQVTVVVDPSKIPGQTAEVTNDLAGVVENAVVTIENGAYDPKQNILYVAELLY